MKIRGKIKKGKVVISKRTRAKRDHFEINLNSYSAGESTILSGRRPVHNMNFKRNSRKYLMKPERCSNLDTSLKAGFTFLMLTPSSMLILYREPAPKLWWREATRKTRKMLKLRQVFEGRFYFSHAGSFFNAPPIQVLVEMKPSLCVLPSCLPLQSRAPPFAIPIIGSHPKPNFPEKVKHGKHACFCIGITAQCTYMRMHEQECSILSN